MLTTASRGRRRAIVAGHSLGAMSIAAWAEHHDVEPRVARGGAAQHRRRRPDRRAVAVPAAADRAGAQPDSSPSRRRPRRAAPLPRFSTPLSSRADPLHRVRPDAPRRRRWRSTSGCWSRTPPDVRADDRDRAVRHGSPARAAAPDRPDARDRRRQRPADPAVASRKIAAMLPDLDGLIVLPTPGTWRRSSAPPRSARAIAPTRPHDPRTPRERRAEAQRGHDAHRSLHRPRQRDHRLARRHDRRRRRRADDADADPAVRRHARRRRSRATSSPRS